VRLTDPESSAYLVGFKPLVMAEAFVVFFFLIWACVTAIGFFSRKASLPLMVCSLLIGQLVWMIIDYFWMEQVFPNSKQNPAQIIAGMIVVFIWVPYFQKSLRVHLTFRF